MIELTTGIPGNGKTLYTISTVKARAEQENRPVYYHGIPGMNLPSWTELEDAREWAKCPPGSIIIIDEAQKIFRNRSMGSTPPEFVQQLETHRHLGIDLVLITQHPSLVDPAVRRLAGRHQHLVRIWGMEASTVHRWNSVKDNCDKSRADSEKTKWAFDKKVYGYYKSAEVHTMKRSIPGRVKVLAGLLVVFASLAWYMGSFLMNKIKGNKPEQQVSAPTEFVPGVVSPAQARPASTGSGSNEPGWKDPLADAQHYMFNQTPRVAALPQTAPKYDALTVPTRVPVPAACIQVGTPGQGKGVTCKCYSQQGTAMQTDFNVCLEIARNGFFQEFDADKDKAAQARTEAGEKVISNLPQVQISTGKPVVDAAVEPMTRSPVVVAMTNDSSVSSQRSNLPDRPVDDGLVPSRTVFSRQ